MANPAPITLEQLFRFYRSGLPHQMAAIQMLEDDLRTNGYAAAMRRDRPWFQAWSQDGKQPEPVSLPPSNPLKVPYYAQLDSSTGQGARMCFSSSCAMLLEYLKPGTLQGVNGDDQYLATVRRYGDTTNPQAQVLALASYGIQASFVTDADYSVVERQIKAGVPVPCGYLHRGHISKPQGGGHWLCIVGFDATHLIVHDPFGEMDMINGVKVAPTARYCYYSRANFAKRWMVDGPASGWSIIAKPR